MQAVLSKDCCKVLCSEVAAGGAFGNDAPIQYLPLVVYSLQVGLNVRLKHPLLVWVV